MTLPDEEKAQAMAAALRQIIDWYENHNIDHVDFRVMACHLAMDALEDAGQPGTASGEAERSEGVDG